MPNLMIGMIDGVWTVQIENVPGIMYTFVGQDAAIQAMWVEEFAKQMLAEAPDLAIAALAEVDLGNAVEVAQVVQQLFRSTSGILLEGESIITAGGGETLFDVLEAAGDALLEALALL